MWLIEVVFMWLILNVISLENVEKFCILSIELLFIIKFIWIWVCVDNIGFKRVWFWRLIIFMVRILFIVSIFVEILRVIFFDFLLENCLWKFMYLFVFVLFINSMFLGMGFVEILIFILLFMIWNDVDVIVEILVMDLFVNIRYSLRVVNWMFLCWFFMCFNDVKVVFDFLMIGYGIVVNCSEE